MITQHIHAYHSIALHSFIHYICYVSFTHFMLIFTYPPSLHPLFQYLHLSSPSPPPCAQTLLLCFRMYSSRDPSIHNTAGVVIRQIVSSMFERLNSFISSKTGSFDWEEGKETDRGQLPIQASDAYLLFQVSNY